MICLLMIFVKFIITFENNKDITYIWASTENIQARYVNQWLKEKKRYKYGKEVAIVLADEGLLQV